MKFYEFSNGGPTNRVAAGLSMFYGFIARRQSRMGSALRPATWSTLNEAKTIRAA
jgi:hypothetical protein